MIESDTATWVPPIELSFEIVVVNDLEEQTYTYEYGKYDYSMLPIFEYLSPYKIDNNQRRYSLTRNEYALFLLKITKKERK